MTGISKHIKERMLERDFDNDDISNALTKPLKHGNIRSDNSKQYIGERATIAINVKTGNLVTGWKTGQKTVKKLKGKENA